jgi:hypothetical protein
MRNLDYELKHQSLLNSNQAEIGSSHQTLVELLQLVRSHNPTKSSKLAQLKFNIGLNSNSS